MSIEQRVRTVRSRIEAACALAGRPPKDVRLVAVTKSVPVQVIRAAVQAGLTDFGENYAKEMASKAASVDGATWHFMGKLQRGTAARIADVASVIHSAEPGEGLRRLARRATEQGRVLPCMAQVDFTRRRQGVPPEDLGAFLADAEDLAGIRIVGLMTLPPWTGDPERTRSYFSRLRDLRDELTGAHPSLRELSMGMSADYEVAVAEGATMVRVGAVLFGDRPGSGEQPGRRLEDR